MFYPTGPQSPAFGVILDSEGLRPGQSREGEGRELPPPGNASKTRLRGGAGKRGEVCYLHRTKRPFEGGILICVCSQFAEPTVFSKGVSPWEAGESTSPLTTPTMV